MNMKGFLLGVCLFAAASISRGQSPASFSYQAVARDASGTAITNQNVSFRISILESSTSGTAVYTESHSITTSAIGLANMEIGGGNVLSGNMQTINWGANPHFLRVELDVSGGTNYQLMGVSQLLSVPYALHANTVANDQVDDADADPSNEYNTAFSLSGTNLQITDGGGTLVADLSALGGNTLDQAYDQGGAGAGRSITADAGEVQITTNTTNAIGLRLTNGNTGVGLIANSTNAANIFSTIQASTSSINNTVSAIIGNTDGGAYGVSGQVQATASAQAGVYGSNLRTNGGHGVLGIGLNGAVGQTSYQQGFGIYGYNTDQIAPLGNAVGTYGLGYIGVWGDNLGTGGFSVYANGDLGASGVKSFHIDHPVDPMNKYLRHFSIESNEVLNIYRGTEVFDANGKAMVSLPDYVDLVNRTYTYHITPVGAAMQLFISREFDGQFFEVSGGQPGAKVSWMLIGERNDPYLQQYPEKREVEVEKTDRDRGTYLLPEIYHADPSLRTVKRPDAVKQEAFKIKE